MKISLKKFNNKKDYDEFKNIFTVKSFLHKNKKINEGIIDIFIQGNKKTKKSNLFKALEHEFKDDKKFNKIEFYKNPILMIVIEFKNEYYSTFNNLEEIKNINWDKKFTEEIYQKIKIEINERKSVKKIGGIKKVEENKLKDNNLIDEEDIVEQLKIKIKDEELKFLISESDLKKTFLKKEIIMTPNSLGLNFVKDFFSLNSLLLFIKNLKKLRERKENFYRNPLFGKNIVRNKNKKNELMKEFINHIEKNGFENSFENIIRDYSVNENIIDQDIEFYYLKYLNKNAIKFNEFNELICKVEKDFYLYKKENKFNFFRGKKIFISEYYQNDFPLINFFYFDFFYKNNHYILEKGSFYEIKNDWIKNINQKLNEIYNQGNIIYCEEYNFDGKFLNNDSINEDKIIEYLFKKLEKKDFCKIIHRELVDKKIEIGDLIFKNNKKNEVLQIKRIGNSYAKSLENFLQSKHSYLASNYLDTKEKYNEKLLNLGVNEIDTYSLLFYFPLNKFKKIFQNNKIDFEKIDSLRFKLEIIEWFKFLNEKNSNKRGKIYMAKEILISEKDYLAENKFSNLDDKIQIIN